MMLIRYGTAAIKSRKNWAAANFPAFGTNCAKANLVVRSGYLPERAVQTGIGPVTVKVPKVRAKGGRPVTFRSALVPPDVRKAKSIEAARPWLYLKGISTGEMGAALKMLLGAGRHRLLGQNHFASERPMGRGIQ